MIIKPILKLASAIVLMGAFSTANALSISLMPSSVLVSPGDIITLDIMADFSEAPTIGGGFDVMFDSSLLTYVGWAAAGLGDPSFGREPDISAGLLAGIAFGDFNGVSGGLVGTLTFEVGNASSQIFMGDTTTVAGPFVDVATFQQQIVDYSGADVNVVPVPAAVWLMFGGLGALFGFSRKRA